MEAYVFLVGVFVHLAFAEPGELRLPVYYELEVWVRHFAALTLRLLASNSPRVPSSN